MSRRRPLVAVVATALLMGAGCSDDESSDPALSTSSSVAPAPAPTEPATTSSTSAAPETTEAESSLPPQPAIEVEPLYGDELAALGLRLTARGGLIDRSDGYEPSATGTHLALYVEPIGDRTAEQYVEGLGTVTAVFSDVFDRWPGLESFDVCQEPVTAIDSSDEPLPITQIELSRSQTAAFDWSTARPVDVVRASLAEPPGIRLRVSPGLADHPSYQAVLDAARAPS